MNITALFSSHYTIGSSILTFEPKGKSKPGAARSIIDICLENGIKDAIVVDSTLGGAYEAVKNAKEAGVNIKLGYKVVVCDDETVKTEDSFKTESKVVIFPRNKAGWSDLIKVANHASTTGFYYVPRTSWKTLKAQWTPDLKLALPFFSSCIARNCLTLNCIIPDFPARPALLREIDSGLPFAPLLDGAIDRFKTDHEVIDTKTIYYDRRADFEQFLVFAAKKNRATFDMPKLDHCASDRFCIEEWRRLRDGS